MKNLSTLLTCSLIALFSPSCVFGGQPVVDVSVVNNTSQTFTEAKTQFGKHHVDFGYIGEKGGAHFFGYPHPITRQAVVTLVTDTGKTNVYRVDLTKVFDGKTSGKLEFDIMATNVVPVFKPVK